MGNQSAFERGLGPLLEILLAGREEAVLSMPRDEALGERVEVLAEKSNEGELTAEERAEYEGYVRANKFVAILRRFAVARKTRAAL